MNQFSVIGLDLAKKNFHWVCLDSNHKIVRKQKLSREEFFNKINILFPEKQTFAFEACAGCHYVAQQLETLGHTVIILKAKDVKPYARSRQKNDINDALAIAKAAQDPELRPIRPKTRLEQEEVYLHKSRKNTIKQRTKRSNSLLGSLMEFGFVPRMKKAQFALHCKDYVQNAFELDYLPKIVYETMIQDCQEIAHLLQQEKQLKKQIEERNKDNPRAIRLLTIPGIGPLNASLLSGKPVESYQEPTDFAASLGLVPRQNTTGGTIQLGKITKQGDRYARSLLIQGARSIVIRSYEKRCPTDSIFQLAKRLRKRGKPYNKICVAVANKLARIVYACLTTHSDYESNYESHQSVDSQIVSDSR